MNGFDFLNNEYKVYDMLNDPCKELLWGLRFVQPEQAWRKVREPELDQIRVAIVDSGIDDHEDLERYLDTGYNFIEDNEDTRDDFGHGTEIAGIIGAEKNNAKGIAGVASGVRLVPLKVCSNEGAADIQHVIDAIEWCMANHIDVINLSIGHSTEEFNCYDRETRRLFEKEMQAIQRAIDKNIVVVSSIGNSYNSKCHFPASYPGVIPVASYGIKLDPASIFSSPKNNQFNELTIFAPGEYIYTTMSGNTYGYDHGNSMSAAFVSGAAALIKSLKRDLSPQYIHTLLLESGHLVDDGIVSFIILDIGQAVEKMLE